MNIAKFKELDSTEERRGIKAKIVPITRRNYRIAGLTFYIKKMDSSGYSERTTMMGTSMCN